MKINERKALSGLGYVKLKFMIGGRARGCFGREAAEIFPIYQSLPKGKINLPVSPAKCIGFPLFFFINDKLSIYYVAGDFITRCFTVPVLISIYLENEISIYQQIVSFQFTARCF